VTVKGAIEYEPLLNIIKKTGKEVRNPAWASNFCALLT
jgi:hypothetical protein